MKGKRSFFERLTGSMPADDEEQDIADDREDTSIGKTNWVDEESDEGELSVDVYQTPDAIIVKAMIASVRPDDLQISITRDMVTIKGKREEEKTVSEEDYYHKELYWGSFTRTILLPQEVEPEEAEAVEKHGLLTITLPKIDKKKVARIKVKSS
ncbi:MAG: Hsp20/alpha crystallin family protein [Patescibacteria group bacterium]|nr:Hsp20/alpha crystallin family protein [Patescibacteria group bacterium]